MRIDVHNHAIPEPVLDLLRTESVYGVHIDGMRWRGGNHVDFEIAESFVDPGAKLAQLARREIGAAVISVAPPLFYYELEVGAAREMCSATNEGLRQMCAIGGDRLSWLAHVPMQDPEVAASVLGQALREPGCVGVEIGSSIDGRRLDLPEFESFWEAAERLRAPVLIHPDLSYEPNPSLSP
ncbi:MAG: amidohydrolase family protein, partial [Solirubrobacterales bacterium]